MAILKDLLRLRLKIHRTDIEIASNSRRRLASLEKYLCLPGGEGLEAAEIYLELLETEESEAERLLPLPGEECRRLQTSLLLDREIPYELFLRDGIRWSNMPGFGRSRLESGQGSGRALFYPDAGIDPFYADLFFGFNALNRLLLKEGFCSVHASCVRMGERGFLFTGPSGSGKSTAALALARRGHPLLNDEQVLLLQEKGGYHCFTLSDMIKLRREDLARFFPELLPEKPYVEVCGERYYKASATPGLRHAPTATADFLITFVKTGKAESTLERIKPSHAVADLFPVTMGGFDPGMATQKFNFLMPFLQQVRCYRIHFGTDMDCFSNLVERMVSGENRA